MSSIIIPSEDDARRLHFASGEVEISSPDNPAPEVASYGNRVIQVFAMNDFVIYVWAQPRMNKGGRQRDAVLYTEVIDRVKKLHKGMLREDGGKPKDETTYEQWLFEHSLKAYAKCCEYVGTPIKSQALDIMLRKLDKTARQVYR